MSGSGLRHRIAPLALLLIPVAACDDGPGPGTTLPSGERAANPTAEPPALAHPGAGALADRVAERARALAARPWIAPAPPAPDLAALDYEAYRSIRFRPEEALWRGAGRFEIQLFPTGFLFERPVRVHLVDDGQVSELPFQADLFRFDGPAGAVRAAVGASGGYSGFRVHYPLNRPDVHDEVVVFQGASFFRLLGPGHVHGLSSRGVAVDIGKWEGEEFPDFTDFWIEKPGPDADSLVFHALLDGPSVTGGYRFVLRPGTVLSVDARLFARRDVEKLGVAPLSSMFLYGPNEARSFDDFRPEVHDSDGVLVHTRVGEWIWRPLSSRRVLRVTALRDAEPRGFGLVQRARDFERYLDLEARYHRRPSEWVRVGAGDWGVGGVELLESPTDSEFSDNVAVSWVPDEPFRAGDERRYRYDLVTFDRRLEEQTLAQVERSRIGWDALPGQASPPPRSRRRVVVDFVGGPLAHLEPSASVEASLDVSAGRVSDLRVEPLPGGGAWRASFRLEPEADRPADMRMHLFDDGVRLSETWSWVWYPDELR